MTTSSITDTRTAAAAAVSPGAAPMTLPALHAVAAAHPAAAVETFSTSALTADSSTAADQATCQRDIPTRAPATDAAVAATSPTAKSPAAAQAAAAAAAPASPPAATSPAAPGAAAAAASPAAAAPGPKAAKAVRRVKYICEVCGEGEGIYRCARCLRRSCSLRCYKQHERESVMAAAAAVSRKAAAAAAPATTTACARANLAAATARLATAEAVGITDEKAKHSDEREETAGTPKAWNIFGETAARDTLATGDTVAAGDTVDAGDTVVSTFTGAAGAWARGHALGSNAARAAAIPGGTNTAGNGFEGVVGSSEAAAEREARATVCPLIRPRVHAVSLQQFDEERLISDLRLLDGAARAVESAARVWRSEAEEALHRDAKKRKRAFCSPQQLRSACAQRQIRFFFCPPAFSRRRFNTTRLVYRTELQQQSVLQKEQQQIHQEQQQQQMEHQEIRVKPEHPEEKEQSVEQQDERRRGGTLLLLLPVQQQKQQVEKRPHEERRQQQQQQNSIKQARGEEEHKTREEAAQESKQQQKIAYQQTHQHEEEEEGERKTLLPNYARRVNCAGAGRQKQLVIEWRLVLRFPGAATERVLPHVGEDLLLEEIVERVFIQERAAAAAKQRKQQQQQEQSLPRQLLRRKANEGATASGVPAAGKQPTTSRKDTATAAAASLGSAENAFEAATTRMSPGASAKNFSKEAKSIETFAPETGTPGASLSTAAMSVSNAASPSHAATAPSTIANAFPALTSAFPTPAADSPVILTSNAVAVAPAVDSTSVAAASDDTADASSAAAFAPALPTVRDVCGYGGEAAAAAANCAAAAAPTAVEETSPLDKYMTAKELVFLLPLLGARKPLPPFPPPPFSGMSVSSSLFAGATHPPLSASPSWSPSAAGDSGSAAPAAPILPLYRAGAGGKQQDENEREQQELQPSEEAEGNHEKDHSASSAFRPLVRRCSGKETLRESLKYSSVVEFPEFFVVLTEELQQFHCVSNKGELPFIRCCQASTFSAAHNPSDGLFSAGNWPETAVVSSSFSSRGPFAVAPVATPAAGGCRERAMTVASAEQKLPLQNAELSQHPEQAAWNSSSETSGSEEEVVETPSEEEGLTADDENEEENAKTSEQATWRGRGSFWRISNRGNKRQLQQFSTRGRTSNASATGAAATGAAAGCRAAFASIALPLIHRRGGKGAGCPDRRLFRGAAGRGVVTPRENVQQQRRTMTAAAEDHPQLLQCQQSDHQDQQPPQQQWPQQQQHWQRQTWQKKQQQRQHHQHRQQEQKRLQEEQRASDRGNNAYLPPPGGRARAFRSDKRGRFSQN